MHPTAMSNCQSFFSAYAEYFSKREIVRVIEIGSQDVNGSLREACPNSFEYIGVDFQPAKGVDVVLDDPYCLPFGDESADIVLSSSCLEHSELFWLVFLEVLRVLKPHGLFYLNVPSTGSFHRYPVDCWRFYPDSGMALVTWAKRNGINASLLESYTQKGGKWQDYVAVFLKNDAFTELYVGRILDEKKDFENGQVLLGQERLNPREYTQDERKLGAITQIVNEKIVVN